MVPNPFFGDLAPVSGTMAPSQPATLPSHLYRTVTNIGEVFQNFQVVFPCWLWDSTWLDMDLQQCNILLMLVFDSQPHKQPWPPGAPTFAPLSPTLAL